jgi:hypothetical protein
VPRGGLPCEAGDPAYLDLRAVAQAHDRDEGKHLSSGDTWRGLAHFRRHALVVHEVDVQCGRISKRCRCKGHVYASHASAVAQFFTHEQEQPRRLLARYASVAAWASQGFHGAERLLTLNDATAVPLGDIMVERDERRGQKDCAVGVKVGVEDESFGMRIECHEVLSREVSGTPT